MEGIAQEVGVDMNELKVVLVGDETQLDVKPFQVPREHYHQVEWDYKKLDRLHNPEPYVEICLKQDVPLLQSYSPSQQSLAFDVKGSDRWTSGERPVDLYQVGSYGSCLSAVRSRLVCAMEGVFNSKGAIKMGAVKSFQGGNHISKKVPTQFAQSPLLMESFLHIQTWHTRYPISGQAYALEFNVSFAGVSGIAFLLLLLLLGVHCRMDWTGHLLPSLFLPPAEPSGGPPPPELLALV